MSRHHQSPLSQITHESVVGALTIVVSDDGVAAILWPDERDGRVVLDESVPPDAHRQQLLDRTTAQLDEYFAGHRTVFDLPLDPIGTDFQIDLWRRLSEIPHGVVVTYGELATEMGRPTASRAVGAATGRNPISIVVPCHRVMGASGSLTGFAGGIDTKRWLLVHEGIALAV